MHILYLHQHFVARSGTSGGRSHEFGRILVQRGHRVTMVTGQYDRSGLNEPTGSFQIDGIEVRQIRVPYGQRMSMLHRILAFLRFMVGATWVATRTRDVDVVFATSTPLTIAVPGMIAAWRHGCPFVFEVRDLWPEIPIRMGLLKNPLLRMLSRRLEALAYRRARHIVALSPGMRDGIRSHGVPASKVTVIPNSSDVPLLRVDPARGTTFRKSHPEIRQTRWIVYAGAFGRVNELDWAVRLMKHLHARMPEACLVLAGEGSEEDHLRDLTTRLGADTYVHFLRPLPRSELGNLLAAADILSSFFAPIPGMETNSANKFFDAFAAGKPVAINYGGWQAEVLRRTGAGLVLDSRDPEGAAREIAQALTDRDWLEKARHVSRRLGDDVFHRRKLADAFEEILAGRETAGWTMADVEVSAVE